MEEPTIERSPEQIRLRVDELRAELDKLGYHVVPKSFVRKFTSLRAVYDKDRFRPEYFSIIRERIVRDMASEIGVYMFHSGAVTADEESNAVTGYMLRAKVHVILRDPKFDRPAWADK